MKYNNNQNIMAPESLKKIIMAERSQSWQTEDLILGRETAHFYKKNKMSFIRKQAPLWKKKI